eukprot:499046-Prorocentrum_minimum.AAC.3
MCSRLYSVRVVDPWTRARDVTREGATSLTHREDFDGYNFICCARHGRTVGTTFYHGSTGSSRKLREADATHRLTHCRTVTGPERVACH